MSITTVALQFTIVDLLSRGLTTIKSRLTGIAQGSKEVQQSFDRMTQSFKYAAMAGIATKEIAKGLRPAINLAAGLQAEMLGVEAELSGAGKSAGRLNDELKAIKATAFSVQAWTPFDMTQIVALEKALVKAGATVESVTGKTGAAAAAAALAVYEKLDPVTTGKSLIGIATPFKIAADQYMDLADKISRAASASTVGAYELTETAKYAAGPMAALGRSSEEMLILSAMMAKMGVVGTMAGTSMKNFFLQAAQHRVFRDAKGNLLPTVKIMEILRSRLKDMGDAQKTEVLKKLFGEQGLNVALALLNEADGSYEKIERSMQSGISLQEKLNKAMGAYANQLESLQGTFKSTIAQLYIPALKPLTYVLEKTNELVAAVGNLSKESDTVGKAVSGVSLGAVATGTALTAALAAAGVMYGRRVLKGAGGIKGLMGKAGSTAVGIAEGKAVQAATGVTPVFVTNWPADFRGGSSIPDITKTPGALKKIAASAPLMIGGKIAAAGAVGYGVGTGINYLIGKLIGQTTYGRNNSLGDYIYDLIHTDLPNLFGSAEVKNDIKMNITVDQNGRATVSTDDQGTSVSINTMNRGVF